MHVSIRWTIVGCWLAIVVLVVRITPTADFGRSSTAAPQSVNAVRLVSFQASPGTIPPNLGKRFVFPLTPVASPVHDESAITTAESSGDEPVIPAPVPPYQISNHTSPESLRPHILRPDIRPLDGQPFLPPQLATPMINGQQFGPGGIAPEADVPFIPAEPFRGEPMPPEMAYENDVPNEECVQTDTGDAYPPCCFGLAPGCPWDLSASFLYLTSRQSEVNYAATTIGGVPNGPIGVLQPGFEAGFRAHAARWISECEQIDLGFGIFNGSFQDTIAAGGAGSGLRSLTFPTAVANAARDYDRAATDGETGFSTYSADYRCVAYFSECALVAKRIGLTYSQLDQRFQGTYTAPLSTDVVSTQSDFDGVGLRLGLDGERFAEVDAGFMVYGSALVTILAGEVHASYDYRNNSNADVANIAWSDDRVVPVLDLESGIGWRSSNQAIKILAGYQYNGWYNVVSTASTIRGIQTGSFSGIHDTVSFDGILAKVVWQF